MEPVFCIEGSDEVNAEKREVKNLKFCSGGKEGEIIGAGCLGGNSHAGCRRDFGVAMCSKKYWVGSSHG
jgi:hypothetical protein